MNNDGILVTRQPGWFVIMLAALACMLASITLTLAIGMLVFPVLAASGALLIGFLAGLLIPEDSWLRSAASKVPLVSAVLLVIGLLGYSLSDIVPDVVALWPFVVIAAASFFGKHAGLYRLQVGALFSIGLLVSNVFLGLVFFLAYAAR